MALLAVNEALERLLDGAEPSESETVAIAEAAGRVLAEPLTARRTQPPFDASAMDGYAVRAQDVARLPVTLRVIGIAPAGKRFAGVVGPGEAVRIFTGAPVPEGADTVVIQEDTRKLDENTVEIVEAPAKGRHIRRRGLDFREGDALLDKGRLLDAAALSLAAAANYPALPVVKRPLLAIIATGDELMPPGSDTGPDQIIASNAYGVAAIAEAAGARVLDLGIAPDRRQAIAALVRRAVDEGADVLVTLGGASVGDHDLTHAVLTEQGMELDFWKIAMRPGKPLMFGRLGRTRFIGLPGNPVASLVCSYLFLKPLLARLGGRHYAPDTLRAKLGAPLPANDRRQDYIRATLQDGPEGLLATPFIVQDSSMLKVFANANALIVREPHSPAANAGDSCTVIRLR
ncbi:molybdopterin molybdenumtransferase MoeA [Pseudaminobacter arsenicus]|uniref:Molybdopterin molybdenumtransferase n=1 Tax=Borborobacter arsenicus TaxID=1851146 RepID=A0A432VB93_9HYPH|nr:gephyrin-like molybdotransferase Glp [Pseudaminobacter arsenicus]RUM99373.1 molybdopterin molybdenumtransferase MoeA [Pseudaminobacter arsenicus]